jgi:glycosyltransferase involved in cell wall biosynthesis
MRKVSIIQREIPHYRIRFFEELYAQGRLQNLEIQVYTGAPPIQVASSPAFPYRVLPVRYFRKKNSGSCWMHGLEKAIAGSDIVVAPQELQCLTVLYLWAKRRRICTSWIWWGHGYNFQASVRSSAATNIKEAIKRFMTRRADGLLTYTEGGADYWRKQGLPKDWVTPYYNTIDVEGLRKVRADITDQQLIEVRRAFAVEGKRVLLFSGRLYAEKKVDFLLNTFALLKNIYPEVALLIIGDGEERRKLEQLATHLNLRDVHFLGELVEPPDTAVYFSLADLMVLPSLVGLAIVHGFAFGLPLHTTDSPGHGPELDYLSSKNGVMSRHDVSQYAEAIASLLLSPHKLEAMKQAAMAQGDELHLSHSARRFVSGIRSFAVNAF